MRTTTEADVSLTGVNQSAYWASRIHLPGHLLSLKGDRPAMHSSVETRYPFLDEDVFRFLAALHPRWKLRGLRDKYVLRLLAERYLPRDIAWRRKFMFRAPMESFFESGTRGAPAWVDRLLSEEALRKTGWFRADAVQYWRNRIRTGHAAAPLPRDGAGRDGGSPVNPALVPHVRRQTGGLFGGADNVVKSLRVMPRAPFTLDIGNPGGGG